YLLIFIIGLCIGSFLNVIILRLAENKNFIKGRSYCPKCKHKLFWYDNIPLISFILLKGKCRYCHNRISIQYPLVELATAILFILAFKHWYAISNPSASSGQVFQFPISNYLLLFSYFIFTAILIIIFVYDFRWYMILDRVSVPAIITVFCLNLYLGKSVMDLLIAAFAIGGFFLLQFLISKGKWIGGGDIRMGFLMGMMLGLKNGAAALFISYILGALVGIFLIIMGKKKMQSRMPFGTFLAVGAYIAMLWGQEIIGWYVNLIRI
ncbi:MAG: prepilin peptidase, partial [bacterium]